MKKILLLIVPSLLLFVGMANAQQQVCEYEAKSAATATLYSKAAAMNIEPDTKIEVVNSFVNSNRDTLMYEVIFENGTTVLLSGSKACLPILGYYIKDTTKSIFDTTNTNVPCCLRAFLYDYIQELNL